MDQPIMRIRGVHKYFTRGEEQIDVLKNLSLDVPQGEFLGIMGPSGSGKTTLLNLIAGLDQAQPKAKSGSATSCISTMSEAQLAGWRTRQHRLHLPVLSSAAGADGL